jgi:hypothetical protein
VTQSAGGDHPTSDPAVNPERHLTLSSDRLQADEIVLRATQRIVLEVGG